MVSVGACGTNGAGKERKKLETSKENSESSKRVLLMIYWKI